MPQELVVFWRLPDDTRCVVIARRPSGWQVRVVRGDIVLLTEDFENPHVLFERALALRAQFSRSAA